MADYQRPVVAQSGRSPFRHRLADAWFEELASGRAASCGEIATRLGVIDRYVSRIVDLAFLAPDVVEAMLAGEQSADVTVKSLTVDGSVPVLWKGQRHLLGIDVR